MGKLRALKRWLLVASGRRVWVIKRWQADANCRLLLLLRAANGWFTVAIAAVEGRLSIARRHAFVRIVRRVVAVWARGARIDAARRGGRMRLRMITRAKTLSRAIRVWRLAADCGWVLQRGPVQCKRFRLIRGTQRWIAETRRR